MRLERLGFGVPGTIFKGVEMLEALERESQSPGGHAGTKLILPTGA